eukprot:CAMPEP_0115709760 /NCGR_PEP_ID=MMETSP0272-20121206/72648_1 /TAXON_ID=71861 /ORGANISM="Scrippsiella trochoidea, Strain CCMP3099" /LENGTH=179 /DNA_ID=CAMNT_0003151401 /DNA_START=15 /DNA_END=552 /DNA_ORIENTATION=+
MARHRRQLRAAECYVNFAWTEDKLGDAPRFLVLSVEAGAHAVTAYVLFICASDAMLMMLFRRGDWSAEDVFHLAGAKMINGIICSGILALAMVMYTYADTEDGSPSSGVEALSVCAPFLVIAERMGMVIIGSHLASKPAVLCRRAATVSATGKANYNTVAGASFAAAAQAAQHHRQPAA